ncbi:MAG: exopolyphosphatase [Rhodospirillaceae bacterium]|nr:exopolyphosphatase [Rhodospirillaceae bacterium]MBL6941043.1 exopolyphosphatase [Rhodospirillales bacterium]
MSEGKFRLVTRSDFDGLVCAVLFKEMDMIDEIKFVHPKDMQDGTILVSENDITTNLPYVKGVHLAFDHHSSETVRLDGSADNCIIDADAPSAARVVYNYYGKEKLPGISDEMMDAVDKSDSAQFSIDEILEPTGWVLLNYIMDARTGLGRYRDFSVSNYQLMMQLIDYCRGHTVEEILNLPDVKERVDMYMEHLEPAKEQIRRCTKVQGNLATLDLRYEETIYATNRFILYALFPDTNISIHAIWGLNRLNTVYAVGKSIVNRTSNTNIGELMLTYGGGGHDNAGTCQVDNEEADRVLEELVKKITADG